MLWLGQDTGPSAAARSGELWKKLSKEFGLQKFVVWEFSGASKIKKDCENF